MLNRINGIIVYYSSFVESHKSRSLKRVKLAICSDNSHELKAIIKEGYIEDINEIIDLFERKTILIVACGNGGFECVKVLLDNNANINKTNYSGNSPLAAACMNGNSTLINYLIDNGVTLTDYIVYDSLRRLVQSKTLKLNDEYVVKFISHVKDINCLYLQACTTRLTDLVNLFLEHGADRNSVDRYDMDALFIASQWEDTTMMRLILEWPAAEPVPVDRINRVFAEACKHSRIEVIRFLMKCGVDVNATDVLGNAPLAYAVVNLTDATMDIVKLLIKHGVDVHTLSHGGNSMLTIARKPEVAKLLIGLGVGAKVGDYTFDEEMRIILNEAKPGEAFAMSWLYHNLAATDPTRLHHMSKLSREYAAHIEILVLRGADPNTTFEDGNTMLLWALKLFIQADISVEYIKFITWLLGRGAEPNRAHNSSGQTALMIALSTAPDKRLTLLKLLLEHGADLTQLNAKGQGVLDILDQQDKQRGNIVALCNQYIELNRPKQQSVLK